MILVVTRRRPLLATVRRLGWTCSSASTLATDDGQLLDLHLDLVANAVKEAVRRLRWREDGDILPGLIPTEPDTQQHGCRSDWTIVACFSAIGSMLNGRKCPAVASPIRERWSSRLRGDLASAVCGGQWSQARKASVPEWGIEDNRCQLCLGAVETTEHRFTCPSISPVEGWPQPPGMAACALSLLSAHRSSILKTHGLLAMKIHTPTFAQLGDFRWIVEPSVEDPRVDFATWYCDGSMLNGKWKPLRVTGFGIAVVATVGDLLAYGMGWPPSWCATASAAEAWTLQIVLEHCPFPPAVRTDCMAVIASAQGGTAAATHHSRPLAKIWKTIAQIVGQDIATLVSNGKLVWVPAHRLITDIGEAKLGNGARFTSTDWRANRLVDKLAKLAAESLQPPASTIKLLESAEAAAAHAACLLGVVTHAANNHKAFTLDEGGNTTCKVMRDSTDRPRQPRATSLPANGTRVKGSGVLPAASASDNAPSIVLPWQPPTPKVQANRLLRAASQGALARRVEEIGARLVPRSIGPSASQRLAALSLRVSAKATVTNSSEVAADTCDRRYEQ